LRNADPTFWFQEKSNAILILCLLKEEKFDLTLKISVSDPDSIRSVDPDPDPGGQKLPTKIERIKKFHV
jgi:hypothetical protein